VRSRRSPHSLQKAHVVIVVVVESKVEPEHAVQALRAAQEGLTRAAQSQGSRRQSRFFQGRDDPSSFMYLGVWENRDGYDTLFGERQRSEVEMSMQQPIKARYFRILSTFERVLVPMEIVVCQLISGPASSGPPLRAFFDVLHSRRGEAGPGLILSMVCEEIDAPGNFVMVSGWRSAEALAEGVAAYRSDFDQQLAAAGATNRRFLGVTRFDSLQPRMVSTADTT
jgi:quinol monooxygenase YgiN